MADYSDIPDMIPQFKRAAIDAFMRTQPYPWTIEGDHYEINSSSTHTKVTRPGADGEGGGDWSSDNFIADIFTGGSQDEKFGESFDNIRSRIDAAIEPWLNLPEPSEISPAVETCRQITRRLSGAAAASSGGQVGAGVIPGNISLIMENSDAMAGHAIAAFKSRFLAQLGPVIGGHHGISLVLGAALASEEGLWGAARQTVADAVSAGLEASRELAESGGRSNHDVTLQVIGWAVKGAKIFIPGAGPVFEVAGLAVDVVRGSIPEEEKKTVSGADAEAVLTAFEETLAALNDKIVAEETLLQDNLTVNLTNIRADQTSYDLSVPPVRDDEGDPTDVIAYQPGLITEITQTYLPTIAAELTAVAGSTGSATISGARRDPSLGIGATGPGVEWAELSFLLRELLTNLSWDVTKAATNLDLVLQDLQAHEDRITQEIEAVLAELDAGNPTDPWN